MSSTQQVLASSPARSTGRGDRPGTATCTARSSLGRSPSSSPTRRCSWPSSSIPSPTGSGWPASPSLYGDLVADPLYVRTVVNTVLFVGLGGEREDVPRLAAVRLLHASPLVDQGAASRLHSALGDAGDSGVRLLPLDADRRGGFSQQRLVGAVRDSRPDLVQ